MATIKQIEANRRNAQKSTGPTSVTGKAASSMNALKSGIHAKSLILPSEDRAELEQLIADYYQRHDPDTPEARFYLDEVIHCEWLLRRYRAAEAQMWQHDLENLYGEKPEHPLGKCAISRSSSFSKLQYRVDATRRAYQRALKALKELKAEAAAVRAPTSDPDSPSPNPSPQTTSPQIGFVLLTPSDPFAPVPTGQYPPLPPSHQSPPLLGAVDGSFGGVLR